ncbi:MAG: DUF1624 domain-containing protein [Burkholderiales bacterium]|jgi:uncharacterized membrane protein|nr:DUF1624 domain-containing protein [Burkholderiales bacterium]
MNKEKSTVARRLPWLDISRGLALWAMIVYHFCFDLQWFGVIEADPYRDPLWTTARTLIITSFLLIVGVSLFVANAHNITPRAFWLRFAKIAVCALIVSVASYLLFPESYIYFGVLHFIAIASLLAKPFAGYPRFALTFGILIVLAGVTFSHPLFNAKAFSLIGFVTELPRTEDYVPLFPWLGVVLIGIGIAPLLPLRKAVPSSPGRTARLLTWMGQRSLRVYMLHQPILIAILWSLLQIARN